MEIDNFKMERDRVKFTVNKEATGRSVEIELVDRGHTKMTDINEFDFLEDDEWYELESFISALSGMLMCNAKY